MTGLRTGVAVRGARSVCAALTTALVLVGALAGAQDRNWPSERPPRPLTAPVVKFPPYDVRTLPNGLQVVAVLHHEQPAVSMRLIVRAGSAQDPSGKPGVASMVSALLDQGTTTKSAQEIAETIDTIGGGLGTGTTDDLTFINVIVMKDSFELGMQLLADVARHPEFRESEIDRQRQQAVSGLRVSYDDPDYVAGVAFDRLVYGFHPYGMPTNGTPQSVAQITRADLEGFHRTYFAPNNAILAVVGDVTAQEAFEQAAQALGDWARAEIPAATRIDPPDATRRIVVIDKPDSVQTEIRVGHVGIERKHPDYMALNLAIKILGGEGANRLHRVLRTEHALTYGASADMQAHKDSGEIVAETDTRSPATGEALRLMVDEFWRLQREPVGERELSDAKAYLTGNFPLTIETPDAIALQVLNVLFYGLDLGELQTFRERVNAVTVSDIERVARTTLKPDRLSIVLVGNAAAFADQLRGVGFGKFEQVPLKDLDLAAASLRRETTPAEPVGSRPGNGARNQAPGSDDTDRARQLVAKLIQAKGGLRKLRSIKTIVTNATTTIATSTGPMRAETRTYIEYPERFRVEARTDGGLMVQTYADGHVWIQTAGAIQDQVGPAGDELRASVRRDVISLLLEAARPETHLRLLPDASIDGRTVNAVEISPREGGPVALFADSSSGVVLEETYTMSSPAGQQEVEEHFSDYRAIDGLQVSFKAVLTRGGSPMVERQVTGFKFNTTLDPMLFKKPSS